MRETIFDHALQLFGEKGFDGASMRELARRAGTTPSNVYNYFSSKEELLREVFATGTGQIRASLEAGGKAGDLTAYLAAVLRTIDEDPALWRMIHQLRMNEDVRNILDPDFASVLRDALGGLEAYTSEPWLLLAIVDGIAASRLLGVPQPSVEEITDTVTTCLESVHGR